MSGHIHMVGIKGVGMTALAIALLKQGFEVSGSDTGESYVTDNALSELGIEVSDKFDESNITDTVERVIYSGAYKKSQNPELKKAVELNLPIYTQQEALAEMIKDKDTIAVAGVGGKTTTSAMIAHILRNSGLDVGYFVGAGKIGDMYRPGEWGSHNLFVAEADEYANNIEEDKTPKLLLLDPPYAVIPNIKFDHPDIYESEDETVETFTKFIKKVRPGGKVYLSTGDEISRKIASDLNDSNVVWVGSEDNADMKITNLTSEGTLNFTLSYLGHEQEIELNMVGEYNAKNAAFAAAVARDQGVSWSDISRALSSFQGVGRRQEYMGKLRGMLLYDDYAHHPSEVSQTIESFKNQFKDKKIWVLFESHTYTRTARMLDDFISALSLADKVSVMPIFSSERERGENFEVTQESLAEKLKSLGVAAEALSFEDAPDVIKKLANDDTLLLTMGAGVVYKLHDALKREI